MSDETRLLQSNRLAWIETPRGAYLILTLTALCLAGNHVIGRSVHGEIPPLGLSFWRWMAGALLLSPFVVPNVIRRWHTFQTHLHLLGKLGIMIVGSTSLLLVALNFTTAINVSLINAIQPVVTVMLAAALLRDRVSRLGVAGIISALCGVVIMLSQADWARLSGLQFNAGDLIAIGAVFGLAFYALNLRKLPLDMSPIESLFFISLSGSLMLLPFYLAESALFMPVPLRASSVVTILELALLVSVFGNLMWNLGNQIVGPSRAAMFINLIPVFGAILAITFLGEELYLHHFAGAAMICLGIWLVVGNLRSQEGLAQRRQSQAGLE